jgi:hypothetical protein
VQRVGEAAGGREGAIAVVVGTAEEAAPLLPRLSAVAMVVVEPLDGPVSQAFHVPGFPAYFVIDGDGIVRASALRPSQLPVAQRA